jgi:hypothetical protein
MPSEAYSRFTDVEALYLTLRTLPKAAGSR